MENIVWASQENKEESAIISCRMARKGLTERETSELRRLLGGKLWVEE